MCLAHQWTALRLRRHVRNGESTLRVTSDAMDTNISRDVIAVQEGMNCLLNARADALCAGILRPRTGIQAFMAKFTIAVATAWRVLSGAVASWFAHVTGTGR